MAEEEPSAFVAEEAGIITSSQEDLLRRSRFIRQPLSPSSSSSGDAADGSARAPFATCRNSAHPVLIRSASDSGSSSDPANAGDYEVVRRDTGLGQRGDEVEGPTAEREHVGGAGEEETLPPDSAERASGWSGEGESRASKRKRSPDGAEEKGGSLAPARRKKRVALSCEGAHEAEGEPSSNGDAGNRGLAPSSGNAVLEHLGQELGERSKAPPPLPSCPAEEEEPQSHRELAGTEMGKVGATADGKFAKFRCVETDSSSPRGSQWQLFKAVLGFLKPSGGDASSDPREPPPPSQNPAIGRPKRGTKGIPGLRKLPLSIYDPGEGDGDDGLGTSSSGQNPLRPEVLQGLRTSSGASAAQMWSPWRAVEGTSPAWREQEQAAEIAANDQRPPQHRDSVPDDKPEGKRLPSNLIDVLINLSKKPDKLLEDVDYLDVLAMKGIHVPPLRWWRPEGYGPQKK